MPRTFSAILFLAFLAPASVAASVRITEVAWMGSAENANDEWIELHNDGTDAVNLSGWTLAAADGAPSISLTGSIAAGAYVLLERTDDSTVPRVAAGVIYTGALSNEGETLTLADAADATVHTASYSASGPGDVPTHRTMQWNGAAWVTAAPTPGSAAPSGSDENDDTSGTQDHDEEEDDDDSTSSSRPVVKVTPKATLTVPSPAYQYMEYVFRGDVVLENGRHPMRGIFRWNFGDGTFLEAEKLEPVIHAYQYPGTYTAWFGYYDNVFAHEALLSASKSVRVEIPALSVKAVGATALEITNDSGKAVDLSGWRVTAADGASATLPKQTIIAAEATITIPGSALGLGSVARVALTAPTGELMASTDAAARVAGAATAAVPATRQAPQVRADEAVVAQALPASIVAPETALPTEKRNRARAYVFGAVALIVIGLFLLLERFMARQE